MSRALKSKYRHGESRISRCHQVIDLWTAEDHRNPPKFSQRLRLRCAFSRHSQSVGETVSAWQSFHWRRTPQRCTFILSDPELIAVTEKLVMLDRKITLEQLAEKVGISKGSVHTIPVMHDHLHMSRWQPIEFLAFWQSTWKQIGWNVAHCFAKNLMMPRTISSLEKSQAMRAGCITSIQRRSARHANGSTHRLQHQSEVGREHLPVKFWWRYFGIVKVLCCCTFYHTDYYRWLLHVSASQIARCNQNQAPWGNSQRAFFCNMTMRPCTSRESPKQLFVPVVSSR